MVCTIHSQKSSDTVDPDKEGNTAILKVALWDDWLGVVRAEERTNFLNGLVRAGVGTNDVENFISKQESIRFKRDRGGDEVDRDNVRGLMQSKLSDSIWDADRRREIRNKLRARLEMILMKKRKSEYKRFIHKVRDRVGKERADVKRLHEKKFREIRMKRTAETKFTLPEGLERYQNAKIFSDDHSGKFVPDKILGPVVVGGNLSLLSKEEVAVLARGPKFTIRRILSRERFLIELEKAFIKIRWSLQDQDVEDEDVVMDAAEKARIEEIEEMVGLSYIVWERSD